MAGAMGAPAPFVDFYEVLGLAEDAEVAEIQRAYRMKSRDAHPDRNPDNPDAARLFHELTVARDALEDPVQRAEFDARRKQRKAEDLRLQSMDKERRSMKDELERREREAVEKVRDMAAAFAGGSRGGAGGTPSTPRVEKSDLERSRSELADLQRKYAELAALREATTRARMEAAATSRAAELATPRESASDASRTSTTTPFSSPAPGRGPEAPASTASAPKPGSSAEIFSPLRVGGRDGPTASAGSSTAVEVGRTVRVQWVEESTGRVTAEDLRRAFEPYGDLEAVLPRQGSTAWVVFLDAAAADGAVRRPPPGFSVTRVGAAASAASGPLAGPRLPVFSPMQPPRSRPPASSTASSSASSSSSSSGTPFSVAASPYHTPGAAGMNRRRGRDDGDEEHADGADTTPSSSSSSSFSSRSFTGSGVSGRFGGGFLERGDGGSRSSGLERREDAVLRSLEKAAKRKRSEPPTPTLEPSSSSTSSSSTSSSTSSSSSSSSSTSSSSGTGGPV